MLSQDLEGNVPPKALEVLKRLEDHGLQVELLLRDNETLWFCEEADPDFGMYLRQYSAALDFVDTIPAEDIPLLLALPKEESLWALADYATESGLPDWDRHRSGNAETLKRRPLFSVTRLALKKKLYADGR